MTHKRARLVGIVAALLVALAHPGQFSDKIFDAYQQSSPRTLSPFKAQVVAIDSESLTAIGPWPWSRYDMARLTDRIAAARPLAIGFDMAFAEEDRERPELFAARYRELSGPARAEVLALPSFDTNFGTSLSRVPTVLGRAGMGERSPDGGERSYDDAANLPVEAKFAGALPRDIERWRYALTSIPDIDETSAGHGLINGDRDVDGVVRRMPAVGSLNGAANTGFALELARIALGVDTVRLIASGRHLRGVGLGARTIPVAADGRFRVRFGLMPPGSVTSAVNLFRQGFDMRSLAGKVVLIGLTGAGSTDLAVTPLESQTAGIYVQAQAVDAILKGVFLDRPPWAPDAELIAGLLLAGLAILILPRMRGLALPLTAPLFVVALVLAGSWLAFVEWGKLFDPLPPIIEFIVTSAAMALALFYDSARDRRTITQAFDRYLSPELVRRIAQNPSLLELGGEERDMSVLFCDIRGYSALSEAMTAQETIRFLTGFLSPMSDVLLSGKATIDKFVGDAIIAFWNAPIDDPDHADNAADAALAMVDKLAELNREMPKQDRYPWPGEVRVGIGMDAGPICVGNIGSEKRLNYSMIGDTVNLASRIEGLTKLYGVTVAIGDSLNARLTRHATIELDCAQVVGRKAPEKLHALLGSDEMLRSPLFIEARGQQSDMLQAYRRGSWDEARQLLKAMRKNATALGLDRLVTLYEDRIALFGDGLPPDGWDGIYRATQK